MLQGCDDYDCYMYENSLVSILGDIQGVFDGPQDSIDCHDATQWVL